MLEGLVFTMPHPHAFETAQVCIVATSYTYYIYHMICIYNYRINHNHICIDVSMYIQYTVYDLLIYLSAYKYAA